MALAENFLLKAVFPPNQAVREMTEPVMMVAMEREDTEPRIRTSPPRRPLDAPKRRASGQSTLIKTGLVSFVPESWADTVALLKQWPVSRCLHSRLGPANMAGAPCS